MDDYKVFADILDEILETLSKRLNEYQTAFDKCVANDETVDAVVLGAKREALMDIVNDISDIYHSKIPSETK